MAGYEYSPQQREEYRKQQIAAADERIRKLAESWQTDPAQIAEYLRFQQQFYQYSPRNAMLIYAQNPQAHYCGSFAFFKSKGYSIRKGEHGMRILSPMIYEEYRLPGTTGWRPLNRSTPPEDRRLAQAGGCDTRERVTGYAVGTVFDIAQTTCPIEDYPKLMGYGYHSRHHAVIYGKLCRWAGDHGFPVTEKVMGADFRGACGRSYIEINQIMGDTQKLDTLCHELGHGLLGHALADKTGAQKEFEADAFSILLSEKFGIEIPDARKDHLAAHYKAYVRELTEAGQDPDIARIMQPIHQRFTTVIKKLIPEIDAAIEQLPELAEAETAAMEKTLPEDPTVGTIRYPDTGEICRYTDPDTFIRAIRDAYDVGLYTIEAEVIGGDPELQKRAFAEGLNICGLERPNEKLTERQHTALTGMAEKLGCSVGPEMTDRQIAAAAGERLLRRACPDLSDELCGTAGSLIGARLLDTDDPAASKKLTELYREMPADERQRLDIRIRNGIAYLETQMTEPMTEPELAPAVEPVTWPEP